MTLQLLKEEMADTIRLYNSKGWSPATSTNYSFMDDQGAIWVSRSGIDKSRFQPNDFITVNENGEPSGEFLGVKPSAETLIHCALYEMFPETKVILHSHSIYPVLLSTCEKEYLNFQGYEIQKGFDGQTSHSDQISIPVFENTQNINEFKETIQKAVNTILHHSFIMRKHGTYAWGKNIFEAKRHLETLEYLCQCEWMQKSVNH